MTSPRRIHSHRPATFNPGISNLIFNHITVGGKLINFLPKIIVLILAVNISFFAKCNTPKQKVTKRFQYASCIDSVLIRQISEVAFSDSIDKLVEEYISPYLPSLKNKRQFCGVWVLPRQPINDDMIERLPFIENKEAVLSDSAAIEVQIIFEDEPYGYKYFTQHSDKIFFILSDFVQTELNESFNQFFLPVKKFKSFSFLSKRYPLPKNTRPEDVIVELFYESCIYVFIYHNGRLYLEPSKSLWEWANDGL